MRKKEKNKSKDQQKSTLQLETATIFEIFCKPIGSCPAKMGRAGCADIVTFTFLTQGRTATTSFAFCSNCHPIKSCYTSYMKIGLKQSTFSNQGQRKRMMKLKKLHMDH
jgi:hypothetical protein